MYNSMSSHKLDTPVKPPSRIRKERDQHPEAPHASFRALPDFCPNGITIVTSNTIASLRRL